MTTVDSRLQGAAVRALRAALIEYDQRHGYRGPRRTRHAARECAREGVVAGDSRNIRRAAASRRR